MDHENNGCIGNPITNMLMAAACAADMGTADHADHGAVVELENGNVITMNRSAANIELAGASPAPGVSPGSTVEGARKTLQEMCYGDMITQEMVDAVKVIVGEAA